MLANAQSAYEHSPFERATLLFHGEVGNGSTFQIYHFEAPTDTTTEVAILTRKYWTAEVAGELQNYGADTLLPIGYYGNSSSNRPSCLRVFPVRKNIALIEIINGETKQMYVTEHYNLFLFELDSFRVTPICNAIDIMSQLTESNEGERFPEIPPTIDVTVCRDSVLVNIVPGFRDPRYKRSTDQELQDQIAKCSFRISDYAKD